MRWRVESRKPSTFFLGAVVLVCAALDAPAQAQDRASKSKDFSSRIDGLFAQYDKPSTPGAIVGVLHKGEIVHLKGYGAANREFDIRWTPDTRYRIASITKGFTSHAALLLQDRGLLSLEDPIQKHLPDFPSFDAPLRIRYLLTMTSGLWQDEWLLPLAGVTGRVLLDEMYALNKRQDRLNYTPGTSHTYIDTNYRLMARIIENVTGKSWQDAMADLIFRPLGMESTMAPPDIGQVFDRQGTTYLPFGDSAVPFRFEFPYQTSGDGSVMTTLNDLILWLRHLRDGFENKTSVLDRLKGPGKLANGDELAYGFGVYQINHRGLEGWGHGGATGTQWFFYPMLDLLVVFFNNMDVLSVADSVRSISDAFLESELNSDPSILSDANPFRDHQYRLPEPLSPKDAAILTGTFVDPESGYFLESRAGERGLSHNYIGAETFLERTGECQYRAAEGVRLYVKVTDCGSSAPSNLSVQYGDWVEPRRFERVTPLAVDAVRKIDYLGDYFSSQLRVHWTIENGEKGLRLRIGAGVQANQVFDLRPLGADIFTTISAPSDALLDIFALPTFAVRFERETAGEVARMHVSTERVQGLVFDRR